MTLRLAILVIAIVGIAASTPEGATAENFHRTMKSGSIIRMWRYRSVDDYCNNMTGTVKVVTKPAHGTISKRSAASPLTGVRFGSTQCVGRVSTALEVYYHSNPGFHGTDAFTLDVDWAGTGRRGSDTFTIDVQ